MLVLQNTSGLIRMDLVGTNNCILPNDVDSCCTLICYDHKLLNFSGIYFNLIEYADYVLILIISQLLYYKS